MLGLGYIGLPTAAMFASQKINVTGVDTNPDVVAAINEGKIHIIEPDLDLVVHATVSDGYLRAASQPEAADAFLIAVPTPLKGKSHEPDCSSIELACLAIAPVIQSGNLIVLESTVPVGTTKKVAEWLAKARPDLTFPQQDGEASDIRIAHCPERVLPGKVMQELITNNRVIGGMTPLCTQCATDLYKSFVTGECIEASNPSVAELAKLTENSFRDVNIAFANELSVIAQKLDIDVWELIRLANKHPRVNVLQPGPGVGGHCIAVDPWFVVSSAPEQAVLIRAARQVNDDKPSWVIQRAEEAFRTYENDNPDVPNEHLNIICYGLSFKPDTDDLRESPALEIVRHLSNTYEGRVRVVEPNVSSLPAAEDKFELIRFEEALLCSGVHVMLVDHRQFLGETPEGPLLVDTRGVWTSRL